MLQIYNIKSLNLVNVYSCSLLLIFPLCNQPSKFNLKYAIPKPVDYM